MARVLRPGGHLLLGHSDFDTMVFNAPDIELTRRLVHANADTQEKWMDALDGTIGRKLVAIARHSPFELCETFAWITLAVRALRDLRVGHPGHRLRAGLGRPRGRAEHRGGRET